MKALVGAFNQKKALVGAFSLIVKTYCETDGSFYSTKICNCHHQAPLPRRCSPPELRMWVPALVLPLLAVAKVAAKQCRASSDCPPQSPHCSDWGWCQVSRHQIQIILLPLNLQHLVFSGLSLKELLYQY